LGNLVLSAARFVPRRLITRSVVEFKGLRVHSNYVIVVLVSCRLLTPVVILLVGSGLFMHLDATGNVTSSSLLMSCMPKIYGLRCLVDFVSCLALCALLCSPALVCCLALHGVCGPTTAHVSTVVFLW
jgi:hypothetical protein